MNNAVVVETVENVRKYRDVKFVPTERRTNYLKEEQTIKPNYHTSKFFTIGLLATEMKKKQRYL